jgi:hypothetical protein
MDSTINSVMPPLPLLSVAVKLFYAPFFSSEERDKNVVVGG